MNMSVQKDILKHLRQYGVAHCHVRNAHQTAFSCQKWEIDDALEPRETMFFFYRPNRAEEHLWAARGWNMVTGVHGCACYKPEEQWVFVSDPGEVYVVGQGDDDDEALIVTKSRVYFAAVKCIAGGYAYAVGPARSVYKRQGKNKWVTLHSKSMQRTDSGDLDDIGFEDIDGFSDSDIYACGGVGDLWHYNGKVWQPINVPTNANLEKVCCAPDGKVYITTNANVLVVGRNNRWEIVDQDVGDYILEEMVCFNDTVYVSSHEKIFEIEQNVLVETKLTLPRMDSYAHLAAGDGIFVVAGIHCAYLYNGSSWNRIFDFS